MPEIQRRLILANAEGYISAVEKRKNLGEPKWPRTYEAARQLVKSEVTTALAMFADLPARKKFADETILCLRLHPDKAAKSYDPEGIFGVVRDLENIGSRYYRAPIDKVAQTDRITKLKSKTDHVTGRLVFVRSGTAGYQRLLRQLDRPTRDLHKTFIHEIQCIEKFDLLKADEQILGFDSDWTEGRIELIFHPSEHAEPDQMNFLKQLFRGSRVPDNKIRMAAYPNGPTFVSCFINRVILTEISEANPLRAAHPMRFDGVETLRGMPKFDSPPPPRTSTRSTIKVGMFDGGTDPNHPLLKGHVEEDYNLSIATSPETDCLAHGTAVAGAVLYGPLNDKDLKIPLAIPAVSVVSVRALPTSDLKDPDLYESIDVIEAAVPARNDVKVWNLSFGPRGPILEDSISRFTYALDLLSVDHKVTFCVAVGNDGEAGPGLSRLQAPSDLVNGLGVGAYTHQKGMTVHAPYSCSGPGRECAKVKPDLAAFGGCPNTPIHLIDAVHGRKVLAQGTSFASPQVASLGGETLGRLERGTALLARALLIHSAVHPDGVPDHLLGHGILASTADDILRCGEREVTVIFQSSLLAKQQVKLPLLLPENVVSSGKISVRWTVACLPPIDPNHPADYTGLCIQDTFYPNDQIFNFTKKDKTKGSKRLHLKNDAAEIAALLADGWKQSKFQATDSANAYPTEADSRSLDYKWEPVVRKSARKLANSLNNPFLTLHAIPRNKHSAARIDYAVVVTISAPKFTGDLYDSVLRRFTALQPVRLRTEAELRIKI